MLIRTLVIACGAILFNTAASENARSVLVANQPLTASPSDQFGIHSNFPTSGSLQQAADRFTLSTDSIITSMEWFGSHDTSLPNGPTVGFSVRFFSDNLGVSPLSQIYEFSVTSLSVDTGFTNVLGHTIFSYETLTPSTNLAAGTYWLSILESDDAGGNDNWAWQRSDSGEASNVVRGGQSSSWNIVTASGRVNRAFTLSGSAVPEPSAFLCLGLLGLGFLMRKNVKASPKTI